MALLEEIQQPRDFVDAVLGRDHQKRPGTVNAHARCLQDRLRRLSPARRTAARGQCPKLVVNGDEAAQVRRIFAMYLEYEAMLPVVEDLERRGWTMKTWRTKSGKIRGGRLFDKSSLHGFLTNGLYVGRIKHKNKSFAGEHKPIVEQSVFDAVQTLLRSNSNGRGNHLVNKYDALLRGILICPVCDKSMVHNVVRRRTKVYRYYTCQTAIKRGKKKCSSPTLPAAEMEEAVVDHIRSIASDANLRRDVLSQSQSVSMQELEDIKLQQTDLRAQLARYNEEAQRLSTSGEPEQFVSDRLARLHSQVAAAERSLAATHEEAEAIRTGQLTEFDVNAAFADFDNVWDALTTLEKSKVIKLLIERVSFDATDSTLAITMHPSAIKSLTQTQNEEPAA